MERLTANLIGNVRRESVDGRAYLVAPVAMIVPGVLNGSKGALMYPQDEVQRNPGVWNNVPITIGHPYGKNNEAISARDPQTLEKFQIGAVYNDRFENGKRVADGWFDEALTKRKAPEVYAALNAGTPMEVSTGLFTDDEPAQNGANYGGVQYQYVAKNYRPDHLAVLPNQRGACSIQDGCGLNTNQESVKLADLKDGDFIEKTPEGWKVTRNAAPNQPKSQNTGKFKAMNAGTGKGETHQSAQDGWHGGPKPQECGCPPGVACNCNMKANVFCPTGDGGGQDNSCGKEGGGGSALGTRADSANSSSVKEKKTKDGKTQYFVKPPHNSPGPKQSHGPFKTKSEADAKAESMTKSWWEHAKIADNSKFKTNKRGPKMNREQGVQWLTTNCDCHKGKEQVLANADNYTDDEIAALVENERRNQTNQLVVNQFVAAVPELPKVKINEIPAFIAKMRGGEEEKEEEAPSDEEEIAEGEKPVGNKKTLTADQYLAQMPESLRPVWDDMVANANDRRNELLAEVDKIVKNERDPARKAIVENKLKGRMTNGELKELIALIRPTANASRVAPAPSPVPAPHYWGSNTTPSTPTDNSTFTPDLTLDVPSIDWAEMASPALNRRK